MAITERTVELAKQLREVLAELLSSTTRTLVAGWAAAWERLEVRFTTVVQDLLASNGGKWPSRRQLNRSTQLNDVLLAAAVEHEQLIDLLRVSGTETARQAASVSGTAQAGLIGSQLPTTNAPAIGTFSGEALSAITRRAAEQITALSRPLSSEAIAAMKRALIRGVAAGEHPDTMARDMVRQVEGRFAGGLTRALTISRTEALDAFRQAAMVSQLANADVLRGWVWLSELSPRTCAACWGMHGTEHPLDEPGPDDHPNGRCARTPLTRSWKSLGFDIPEPPSIIPDSRSTFAAMSRTDQLAVMGPARLDLLNNGSAKWADLASRRDNPGWRPSYTVTPLKDLAPS